MNREELLERIVDLMDENATLKRDLKREVKGREEMVGHYVNANKANIELRAKIAELESKK